MENETPETLGFYLDFKQLTNHRVRLTKNTDCLHDGLTAMAKRFVREAVVDALKKYAGAIAVKKWEENEGKQYPKLTGLSNISAKTFYIEDNSEALHRFVRTKHGEFEYGMFEFEEIDGTDYIIAYN